MGPKPLAERVPGAALPLAGVSAVRRLLHCAQTLQGTATPRVRPKNAASLVPCVAACSPKRAGQAVHEHTEVLGSCKRNQLGQDLRVQPRPLGPICTEEPGLQRPPQGLPQDGGDGGRHCGRHRRRDRHTQGDAEPVRISSRELAVLSQQSRPWVTSHMAQDWPWQEQ